MDTGRGRPRSSPRTGRGQLCRGLVLAAATRAGDGTSTAIVGLRPAPWPTQGYPTDCLTT